MITITSDEPAFTNHSCNGTYALLKGSDTGLSLRMVKVFGTKLTLLESKDLVINKKVWSALDSECFYLERKFFLCTIYGKGASNVSGFYEKYSQDGEITIYRLCDDATLDYEEEVPSIQYIRVVSR